jgi:hypothetical protein
MGTSCQCLKHKFRARTIPNSDEVLGKTRVRTSCTVDPQLFTCDVAVSEAIKMVNLAEEATTDKESDIKLPEKFKLTSKWIVFAESVDT